MAGGPSCRIDCVEHGRAYNADARLRKEVVKDGLRAKKRMIEAAIPVVKADRAKLEQLTRRLTLAEPDCAGPECEPLSREDYYELHVQLGQLKIKPQVLGPRYEWDAMRQECVEYLSPAMDYIYAVCPFDKVYQGAFDRQSQPTLLGQFMGWEGEVVKERKVMSFGRGEQCFIRGEQGPQRSAQVEMMCGDTNEILSVTEPFHKCHYLFKMVTPAACFKADLPKFIDIPGDSVPEVKNSLDVENSGKKVPVTAPTQEAAPKLKVSANDDKATVGGVTHDELSARGMGAGEL